MDTIRQLIQTTINTFLHNPNQFASGGMLLMAIGAIGASLRKIPIKIWAWIVHQTTVSIAVTDDQRAYYWTKVWLETRNSTKRTRHLDVMNRGPETYALIPAPGKHWIWYKWRPIIIRISRTEEKAAKENWMGRRSESLTMTTIGRKQNLFRSLMLDIRNEFVKEEEKKPELHAWGSYGEWSMVHGYVPRTLDSVILPYSDKQKLVKDIEHFRTNRKWYGDMGIPYRKGYLFHGPPGTGKTSLVTGLSSHFKSNVYVIKLSDMTDATLREAISTVAENSFLVMEDIDTVNASKDRDSKDVDSNPKLRGVTLSGLLNVIDGVLSPSGAVFVLTTNHKEKLDPALVRPGRVDMQFHITYATTGQKQQLYDRFFPGQQCPDEYLEKQMSMAELQQALMERRMEQI
jgi:chaperone BCS1